MSDKRPRREATNQQPGSLPSPADAGKWECTTFRSRSMSLSSAVGIGARADLPRRTSAAHTEATANRSNTVSLSGGRERTPRIRRSRSPTATAARTPRSQAYVSRPGRPKIQNSVNDSALRAARCASKGWRRARFHIRGASVPARPCSVAAASVRARPLLTPLPRSGVVGRWRSENGRPSAVAGAGYGDELEWCRWQ